jgi:hypothetical protein
MVAFRYPTVNRKILTFACHGLFQMNGSPLKINPREARCLPHPEHDHQQRVNNFWSCIMSNQGGNWMQMIVTEVLAVYQRKRERDTLPASF